MDSAIDESDHRQLPAYIAPMGVFLLLLAFVGAARKIGGAFWLSSAEYWIYPLQAVLCGVLLIWYRRVYAALRPRHIFFSIGIGAVVFVLWIAPQAFFGFTARTVGFNPDTFHAWPAAYWFTVGFRFLRLVVVVPLVEEIFWRGFLLRYFIDERFSRVSVGTFSWLSFSAVTVGFTLVHSPADWVAAFITGALYNAVAYRTKSIGSCVIAHALTNLLLGCWIMHTKQWGFW